MILISVLFRLVERPGRSCSSSIFNWIPHFSLTSVVESKRHKFLYNWEWQQWLSSKEHAEQNIDLARLVAETWYKLIKSSWWPATCHVLKSEWEPSHILGQSVHHKGQLPRPKDINLKATKCKNAH